MNIYELILNGLQTKFTGADEATLQRIATKKADGVTDESQVNSIIEGVGFMDVMNNYGDFRADGASKTSRKNAIADYESKYKLKDGKPIADPNPAPQVEPKPSQGLSAEDIAKIVQDGIAKAINPINDRFTKMDEENERKLFEAKVEDVAKSFGIPAFAYKGKAIDRQADLNDYFKNLKQEMTNEGFQFAPAPQSSAQKEEKNSEEIASLIGSFNSKK